MSMSPLWRALAALFWVPAAVFASATHTIRMDPGAPVGVDVCTFHDSKPTQGFMPVRVTLTNDSDRELRYTLGYAPSYGYDHAAVSGEFSFSVAPGVRKASIVYIPVVPSDYQGSTRCVLRGPGVREGSFELYCYSGYRGVKVGQVGMGEGFSVRHLGAIESEAKKSWASSGNFPVTKISSAYAPADRRAYDAFSTLWFDAADWAALEPATKLAVREWVLLGGRLYLVSTDAESVEAVGFGSINRVRVGADDTAFGVRAARLMADTMSPVAKTLDGQPRLFAAFKSAAVDRPVALIILLIGFGLVVGPVNLFVFAKPPRRHRLLWTTPLIALVAAVLLLVAILFTDGTGGSGRRYALGVLDPESRRIALWQQQISRTGLLLGDDFAFESSAMLVPTFESSATNRRLAYEKTGDGWKGDWFAGRNIGGQSAFDTPAARGGVRVTTDASGLPVAVESSLEFPLSRVVVVSRDGRAAYEATGLAPGVSRPLKPVGLGEASLRWPAPLAGAGEAMTQAASMAATRNGFFYAELARPEALIRPTLKSIEWRDDVALLTGPAEFRGAATK